AVVMRDGFAHVLVVGADRRLSLKRVQTGRMVENRIEIKEGLLQDQTVAVRGAAFLNDGDLVQISADTAPAPATNILPAR
ncbi:MAG: efflux transporter periplasmic adaptor subunit, partial [Candidatus Competibacter sp.]